MTENVQTTESVRLSVSACLGVLATAVVGLYSASDSAHTFTIALPLLLAVLTPVLAVLRIPATARARRSNAGPDRR